MNVHISYKVHKTPDIEKDVHHHIEKLRKRLQVFRPELVHLKGLVEQSSPREGTTVSLNLRLPSGQMAVQQAASTPAAAVKSAFDDLLQQISKHKDLLRSTHKWARRGQENPRPQRQVPFEQTLAAIPTLTASADDVRSYVNANLTRLDRFIARELVFRETAGQLQIDSVSKEEVIDEVVACALGDTGGKPDRLALEPWLYRLALHAIEDFAKNNQDGETAVHLEQSARQPNVRASDEPELQFHQPDESLTEESVIADTRVATPEDIASSDEMIALVQFALGGVLRLDREAFILNVMEGFSIEEIAAITDRKPDEIQTSIGAAREHLRKSPPVANRFKDKLLQPTGTV